METYQRRVENYCYKTTYAYNGTILVVGTYLSSAGYGGGQSLSKSCHRCCVVPGPSSKLSNRRKKIRFQGECSPMCRAFQDVNNMKMSVCFCVKQCLNTKQLRVCTRKGFFPLLQKIEEVRYVEKAAIFLGPIAS